MYIVQVASELAPLAKVGGLADVVCGLSWELSIRGNEVEVILPKYDCMRYDQIWGLTPSFNDLWVPWFGGGVHCTVWFGFVHGRKCFFIDPHSGDNFFNRNTFYGCNDDVLRYAFFSKAALEFLLQSGKRPDIIHCHDWQTGLLPVMLFEQYTHTDMQFQRACYTIHNFKHQGIFGHEVLHATGLGRPEHFFDHNRLKDNHNHLALNCMKGGIVYSNFVTTVSPHHAWEARFTDQGYGLNHTLHQHHQKFGGILNGIDYATWNPEIDPLLAARYSAETIQDKYINKEALRDRLWLNRGVKPIIAYIGRLDEQKGLDLVYHSIHHALSRDAQFVLLGTASNHSIHCKFQDLKHQLNDNPDCHIELSFNEELSHLIYAGADMVIVPSAFEPCGLTQIIALKYGTVPIVRSVGGLSSTVFDYNYSEKPMLSRNGYTFDNFDTYAVESTLNRTIGLYYDFPHEFRQLMINGMNCDYSWNHPGSHYVNIFNLIRHK
ncbi:glycogen synthase [Chitinispirillales bacterium ANBcel5]|uniref:glycogen synthase n=1 Tax=Cellulosispirillum alkaliphilum TaxID=3039283 RepID=UPI002A57888F|nr:glycogen synthase [Chitinispirillales bacterium ANBcel5]